MAALALTPSIKAGSLISPERRNVTRVLDSAGLSLGFSHVFELIGVRGEAGAPTFAAGGLTNVEVRWQPKPLGFLRQGSFTAIYAAYSQTRTASLPDLQGISNLTVPSFRHWQQAYFDMPLTKRARIKVGKVDANTEFSVIEGGADFSNAAAGVNPALFTMPSYPDGALSANVFLDAGRGVSAGTGIYRAIGGQYVVGELGKSWSGRLPGRAMTGIWHQRTSRPGVEAMPSCSGTYVIVEQTLLSTGAGRGLQAFVRFSTADQSVAPASLHDMYGASWTGLGSRRNDSAGIAFLHLMPARMDISQTAEAAYEVYYRFPLRNCLSIKVDLQRVTHPGGLSSAPSFVAASVRLFINLSTASSEPI